MNSWVPAQHCRDSAENGGDVAFPHLRPKVRKAEGFVLRHTARSVHGAQCSTLLGRGLGGLVSSVQLFREDSQGPGREGDPWGTQRL